VVATARKLEQEPLRAYVVRREEAEGVTLVDFSRQLPEFTFHAAESLSHASSRFVAECRRADSLRGERETALEAGQEALSRLTRTLHELEKDRARQEEHQRLQEDADLLLSQLAAVKKGQAEVVVDGPEGERRLTLDPRLRPQEQAERWYQEARRLRRGMAATEARIERLRGERTRLEALLNAVAGKLESEDPKAAAAFADLERLVVKRRPTVRVKQEPVRFRRFRSPGGLAIWVGRNNRENDELTLHAAHKEDLWFHAQQCPGSHVVLRSHALRDHPAASDVLAAAATAAYYSRARTSKKVPVIYTLAKYVRKPRKAAAGTVTVEREKSILVEPRLCPVWDE
jgi:predicted ribosome quality control (RQC) complex YloA/Tae2 family protein